MSDVFLGVIAGAVLVMAVIQVAAVVFAARAARRLDRLVDRLEQDIRPIVASLQTLTADAARATTLAAAQVERVDRVFGDLAQRVEQALASFQQTLVAPARDGLGWLGFLKTAWTVFQDLKGASPATPRRASVEDDDALFIG